MKWQIAHTVTGGSRSVDDIITQIVTRRGIRTTSGIDAFLHPVDPYTLRPADIGIDVQMLARVITRIRKAIQKRESIVVYADYDADGISAGSIMWKTLYELGAHVMPYIPHRETEGYGLSEKGIDAVRDQYDPTLIITVDHGITARHQVEYARKKGIEVVITDHHTKPIELPKALCVHTTAVSGAGVAWFVAKELSREYDTLTPAYKQEMLAFVTLGTIADMMPLVGPNRSIASYGLDAIRKVRNVGIQALLTDAGITKADISTYDISHVLAPRINAMGRLEHAIDSLRLLCTKDFDRAHALARKLGLKNQERQQLTTDTVEHAGASLLSRWGKSPKEKLLFIADTSYNPGIIGLVAGKLAEEYYRPSIVASIGEIYTKASARSVPGYDIIAAIRACMKYILDAGGHPMAAGFTVLTKDLSKLQTLLEKYVHRTLDDSLLEKVLRIDVDMPLINVTEPLWKRIRRLAPYGIGNPEPVFAARNMYVKGARLVGRDQKHLKCTVTDGHLSFDAIAFGMGHMYPAISSGQLFDVAYGIDMNEWNGRTSLQLKVRDMRVSQQKK